MSKIIHDPSLALPPARSLVIDDEPQIRRFLDISLRAQGYQTLLAATGEEGQRLLAEEGADLVILDLGLPDQDGRDVLKAIRLWSDITVIVLTVRADEYQKVALLDTGANDYVTKPFGIEELMARIRAFLRNRSQADDIHQPIYDDGHLRIDLMRHEVVLDEDSVALTPKEFALLAFLVRQPGGIVTQTQLLREIWGPTHQDDAHYLRILVNKLRSKLCDNASSPRYIITEPGVGLRFIPQH